MLFRERTLLWPWGPMLCFELNLERIGGGEATPWDFKSLVAREWTGIKTIIKRKSRQSVLDIIVRKGYKDLLNGDLIIQVGLEIRLLHSRLFALLVLRDFWRTTAYSLRLRGASSVHFRYLLSVSLLGIHVRNTFMMKTGFIERAAVAVRIKTD